MATTSARAVYGMSAIGAVTLPNSTGQVTIGTNQASVEFADATVAYAIGATLPSTKTLTINVEAGTAAVSGGTLADGDGLDFQGATIPTIGTIYGILIEVTAGAASATNTTYTFPCPAQFWFPAGVAGDLLTNDLVITASAADTVVAVTILCKP